MQNPLDSNIKLYSGEIQSLFSSSYKNRLFKVTAQKNTQKASLVFKVQTVIIKKVKFINGKDLFKKKYPKDTYRVVRIV
jgi:hypothetical protein